MTMDSISMTVKKESIKSFKSTISKFEKALAQMNEKGVNTTLIQKLLHAHYVGLAVLENAWHQKPHPYSDKEWADAHIVFAGLFPSLENAYGKSKASSPQKKAFSEKDSSSGTCCSRDWKVQLSRSDLETAAICFKIIVKQI